MNTTKETIYIDASDDITAVIEHIKGAADRIVALVLPKSSEVLRSVVNMKLLNKSAKTLKKQVVLITSDKVVLGIAGSVGMYTASSLSTKPEVPAKPERAAKPKAEDLQEEVSRAKPVEHSKATTKKKRMSLIPKKKGKKLKVPNFDAFRLKLILAVVFLLLLPVLWFVMFKVLPSAKIVITTNARSLPVSTEFTIDTAASSIDQEALVIPATKETNKQQYTSKITATGEKEVGEKASGLMTVSNCTDLAVTINSGTIFTAGGLNFISQAALSLDSGSFSSGGVCKSSGDHVKTVTVIAEAPGDGYNLSSRPYAINGVSGDVRAQGGSMSGGVSKVAIVISQADIDKAVAELEQSRDDLTYKQQLIDSLTAKELIVLDDTFKPVTAGPSANVAVDQEIAEGLVTQDVTYELIGVKQTEVLELVLPKMREAAGQLEVIESGIAEATYTSASLSPATYNVKIDISGSAGLILDKQEIFESIKNRPADEAAAELRLLDGVTSVEASTSPFWITSIPGKFSKVNIEINGE